MNRVRVGTVSSTATLTPTVPQRTLSEATGVPKGEGEEGEDGSPPDTKNGRSGEGEGAAPG